MGKTINEKILILGIDTSCDDTSASVVENGSRVISNIVSNQDQIHKKYGGIVPELASRKHIEVILPATEEAMKEAGATFKDISAIAVSYGPGLIGSLLVGVCFAKSLSFVHNVPMVSVNHLEGHICSVFLEAKPEFPFVALVVSGGHTSLYIVKGYGKYKEIGRTRDDAAGEAYDKVAKLLGFGYPGGPVIDELSSRGNKDAIVFPRAELKGSFDFSFSGLKTSVLNYTKKNPGSAKEDIGASFQEAVVDVLVRKTVSAAESNNIKRIVLSGGVSANSALREAMQYRSKEQGIDLFLPSLHYCTDNAAMIAAAGYHHYLNGVFADISLNPKACLPLGSADG